MFKLALAVAVFGAQIARADDGPPTPPPPLPDEEDPPRRTGEEDLKPQIPRERLKDIVVEVPGERSSANIASLVGVSVVALASGLLGVHFHLEGKELLEGVNADSPTGKVWTQAMQDDVDHAAKDRKRTIVLYSVSGALIVGAIVALIATDPESTTTVIHPRASAMRITPTESGAIVGAGWSF